MARTPLQPLRYDKQITFWISSENYTKLCQIAKDKGYGSHWQDIGIKLKQPKTGAARLIREIVEKYIQDLDKH